MVILAALFLIGVIAELWAVIAAPFGYQDETGFHTGIKPGSRGMRRTEAGLN